MRYIGNKTRLLPFLMSTIERLALSPKTAHDAFSGTAAVGRALKGAGWRVASSDLMTYSYVFQRAYVVAQRSPSFAALRAGDAELRRALRSPAFRRSIAGKGALGAVSEYLARWVEGERGFIGTHFAPAGGRMYFTQENADRIDAIRRRLHEWRTQGLIQDDGYYVLLAALIEGADRIANTAGVYAAYIKRWQANARRPLTLKPELPQRGPRGATANRADAAAVAKAAGELELIYIDPPYNARQYSGYYHVPEVIARGWFDATPVLRGKTGLVAGGDQKSEWCSPRKAGAALATLLAATSARHALVSYNSEGLLSERDLRDVLAGAAKSGTVTRFSRGYRRYRSDSDRVGRVYQGDRVRELLYHVCLR
ncbi:MAG: DNA adenine methylase [Gemmatimonadaceae bacterium]|nr:DNA adenine methylase [Gemmatimonadaceae bacterium]